MLTPDQLHPYQARSVDHVMTNKQSLLFLDPGLGKTAITLTAIAQLMHDSFEVHGVLVVAPLRVCQAVWKQEAAKWEQSQHLTFSSITGSKDERIRGLMKRANIYLINYDNLQWLQTEVEYRYLSKGKYPPWNMIVFDEVSKLKNTRTRQGTSRGKAALQLRQYTPYAVGLTGTPASNGLGDLFGQALVIDWGERLGTSYSAFQSTYFYQADYKGYRYVPFEKSGDQIAEKLGDITLNLKAEDYLDMPDLITNDITLHLPTEYRDVYDRIETEMRVELSSGEEVEIFNQASLSNRCLQYAGGGIYKQPGLPDWEHIHDIKLDALEDIVEESAGKPILVLYAFQHEAKRIQKRFKNSLWISSKTSEDDFNQAIMDWNTGRLTMIVGHPASMGHGIDRLQQSCRTIVWFGLPWSLELYDQSIARIHRQGQQHPVINHRLMMHDTVDDAVALALANKATDELNVRNAIEQYLEAKA